MIDPAPICQGCGVVITQGPVLHHVQAVERRVVRWTECVSCHCKAEKRAAELKAEAEADRLVKLPPPPPRKRPPTNGPFALQIEEQE